MIELRDYQHRALDELRPVAHQRPILALPTGSGKTTVAAELTRRNPGRTLFLAHRRELIHQAHRRYADFGIHAGICMAGEPRTADTVQVGSIQTLVRRVRSQLPPADLVLVDEAHHARGLSYLSVLRHYPHATIVGLTATPFRLDGRGLGFLFGAIVAPVTVRALVDRGVILEPLVLAPSAPDLSRVGTVGADYHLGQLANRMDGLTGDIVAHWQRHARQPDGAGRRTLVFAVNVAHSKSIVERFVAAGVRAEHVDATSTDRDQIFARLASGQTEVVSNVGIATEGWDLPSLEVAILARPTKSLCLHLQMVGRVMRAAEGKRALVLDHAGNHLVHGPVTDPIEYSLDEKPRLPQLGELGQCKACYAIFRGVVCPNCGAIPVPKPQAPPVETAEDLARFERSDLISFYADYVRTAAVEQRSVVWARNRFKKRFGKRPPNYRHIEREHYQCRGHRYVAVPRIGWMCTWCHDIQAAA